MDSTCLDRILCTSELYRATTDLKIYVVVILRRIRGQGPTNVSDGMTPTLNCNL